MPKPKTGRIWFDDSDPISYGGSGQRNPRYPWKWAIEGGTRHSARTYADAANYLAQELSYHDAKAHRLHEQWEARREVVRLAEYARLMADDPDAPRPPETHLDALSDVE